MLRLMTLNLNYRVAKHGAWSERCKLIAQAIARVQADVVALQAVERTGAQGQAAELATLLNFEHSEFIAAMKSATAARGSAFIGRRRFLDLAAHLLSHRGDHEDNDRRAVVKTCIHVRGGALNLYNAHFSWVPQQAEDNAKDTLEFIGAGPGILFGDLNSEPESPPLKMLRDAGWSDVWTTLRGADPGYTFEADRPSKRIDYVLASTHILPKIQSIECVGSDGKRPPRLSDHLGLVVTLSD